MKFYQKKITIFWLLLYFTKPAKCNQLSSWTTLVTKHGTNTVVIPKDSQHAATQRTNFTSGYVPKLRFQNHRNTTQTVPLTNRWQILSNSTVPEKLSQRTTEEQKSASDDSPENLKGSPTFFYTHIEPNRFEYRAMFHHNNNGFKQENFNNFNPFTDDFPSFPKVPFPQFPSFPSFPELFQPKSEPEQAPPPFHFPTVPPSIRRILQPTVVDRVVPIPRVISNENIDGPLKKYDIVLGNVDTKYPKIFRFNEERMSIVEFEKQKKLKFKLGGLSPNSISGPEHVPREQFLILHGGIFTVQEPPIYGHNKIRKRKLSKHRNFYKNSDD